MQRTDQEVRDRISHHFGKGAGLLQDRGAPREYVLVVEGKSPEEKRQEEIASWESMSIEEHMAYYEEQGMDNKSAMKQVAKDRGVGKREIYQYLHGNS